MFAWFRRCDRAIASAIRGGTVLALLLTVPAAQAFMASAARARNEAALAIVATAIVIAFARMVWRGSGLMADRRVARYHSTFVGIAAMCAVLIVVRQTMEIAYVFEAAVFQVRSFDATAAIVVAVALALAVVVAWVGVAGRLSDATLDHATRAFAIVFLFQVAVYAFHESAEARLLPWSDALHQATEPYGPDGVYGMHLSELLVIVPICVALSIRRARSKPIAPARLMTLLVVGVSLSSISGVAATAAVVPDLAAVIGRPHLLFRETGKGPNFGLLSAAPLDAPESGRVAVVLSCDRVSFAAANGICLHGDPKFFGLFVGYTARLFDRDLQPRAAAIKLEGRPSRTRVSAAGRLGAITVFVVGDDYASASFSTRTTIVDMKSGVEIGELEQFTTWRNGERFSSRDFNFWGITFARDENTFYASLRTGGSTYLVRGDVAARVLTVMRDNVECPSLSPDGRLVAFKKYVGPDPGAWRLAILDVPTMRERVVAAETRYIDDQVEWLDAAHILYGVPQRTTRTSDIWVAPIDGDAPARIFLPEAESPIVVR